MHSHSWHQSGSAPEASKGFAWHLTFERHKEAQSAMQDAKTPSARFEYLIPKTELLHTNAVDASKNK